MPTYPSPFSYLISAGGALEDPSYAPPSSGDYLTSGYVDFDGIDDHITFGARPSAQFQLSSTFTISFWVRNLSSASAQHLLGYFTGSDLTSSDGWAIYRSANFLRFALLQGGSLVWRAYDIVWPTPSAWNHFALVFSGGSLRVYINGAVGSATQSIGGNPTMSYAGSELSIGRQVSGTQLSAFLGEVAEVAIWSSDQTLWISEIYNDRKRRSLSLLTEPPDILYAPLSVSGDLTDGTAGGVTDFSGSGDGTSVNMDAVDTVGVSGTPEFVTSTEIKYLDTSSGVVSTRSAYNVVGYVGGTGSSFP